MTIITDRKKGFTLAEVLITLTIIGVVAALTIPSLLANVNDKTYDAKRKGFATRLAQAVSQIDVINAYEAEINAENNSSMNFIVEALSKVYKISSVCDFENFKACDFPDRINMFNNTLITNTYAKWSNLNGNATAANLGGLETKAAAFRTKNGESVLLYYNPKCVTEQSVSMSTSEALDPSASSVELGVKNYAQEVCINIIYDLDGSKKGPNLIGSDIGYAIVLYSDTPYLVMPEPFFYRHSTALPSYKAGSTHKSTDTADGGCTNSANGLGHSKGSYSLPSREELYANGINQVLNASKANNYAWSSSIEGPDASDYGWMVNPSTLKAKYTTRNQSAYAYCILGDKK